MGCLWHLRRYVVWSRACLCRWGWGPFPGPPGAWHRGAIYAGSAPINLVMLAQTYLHGLVQTLPDAIGIPVTQAPPAGHTTAVTQGLRQVFHGMPVCCTNRMPLSAASSLTVSLRAPPSTEGVKAGIRGCSCRHSSLLTGCLAMRAKSINASG